MSTGVYENYFIFPGPNKSHLMSLDAPPGRLGKILVITYRLEKISWMVGASRSTGSIGSQEVYLLCRLGDIDHFACCLSQIGTLFYRLE